MSITSPPTKRGRFDPAAFDDRYEAALTELVKAKLEGRPIRVFNEGRMRRDFTYVDDIVEGVIRTLLAHWQGLPPERWTALNFAYGACTRVDVPR